MSESRVQYGDCGPNEGDLKLLGRVADKRVLLLGDPTGEIAIALTEASARVTVVQPDCSVAREATANAGAKVEFLERGLAELASVRAESIDAVLGLHTLVDELDPSRVFRQVHRVLRQNAPLVVSYPHPLARLVSADETSGTLNLTSSYFDETTPPLARPSDLMASLTRAGYRVDALLEPKPDRNFGPPGTWRSFMASVPSTFIIRGRREG